MLKGSSRSLDQLRKFLIFVIFYNILVILWGAYVRATGSGAGCGSHWPLCNGQVIPIGPDVHTQIEYFHRLSSGLSLPLVLVAGRWIFRSFPKGSWIRKPAGVACISIVMEALIGAGLVLFELVSHDQSLKRTVSIALHFVNTLILLGSLVLTTTSLSRMGKGWTLKNIRFKRQALSFILFFLAVGIAGAITALGDTLFPSHSVIHGIQQDWDPSSHFLTKLRIIHPVLAVFFVLLSTPWIYSYLRQNLSAVLRVSGKLLVGLLFLNVGIGVWNLMWLVPIGLQITHLTFALTIWIAWVVFLDQALT